MEAPTKLAGFALGVVTAFGGAAGLGAAVGPQGGGQPTHNTAEGMHADTAGMADMAGMASTPASEIPGGLMVTQDGYTLDLAQPALRAGDEVPVLFRVLGPDGQPVTEYTEAHGKQLHLIAVRRDMAGFQHVHPTLDESGTWSTRLDLSRPGEYRVFTDLTPAAADDALTLGADLSVAGTYEPQPLPAPSRTAEVDGYTVTLDGALVPGGDSQLTLSIGRDGEPVTDLQPYLEAYGHLVALRDGDLAYLHVHPAGSPGDGTTEPGPQVVFYASVPSAGDYRLFLDFRHGGQVHTAEFTVHATRGDAAATTEPSTSAPTEPGSDDHGSGDAGHGH